MNRGGSTEGIAPLGSRKPPLRAVPLAGLPDTEPARLKLALAQMSARLRRARRQFHEITGLTAVTSLRSTVGEIRDPVLLSPPVHHRCAEFVQTPGEAPCNGQWHEHMRASLRSPASHTHTCPLGLRCSCVPIYLGGVFVGVAKLVADSSTPAREFAAATATLSLAVSLTCHESYSSVLRDELRTLRQQTRDPLGAERGGETPAYGLGAKQGGGAPGNAFDTAETARSGGSGLTIGSSAVVDRTLDYLHEHHRERDLSLPAVAAAVGCNGKYLTHLFTQVVGQRMHGYIIGLRVERASRKLLDTDLPVKRIAVDSGFGDAGHLVRAFHRHVGVSPSQYRRIFAGR